MLDTLRVKFPTLYPEFYSLLIQKYLDKIFTCNASNVVLTSGHHVYSLCYQVSLIRPTNNKGSKRRVILCKNNKYIIINIGINELILIIFVGYYSRVMCQALHPPPTPAIINFLSFFVYPTKKSTKLLIDNADGVKCNLYIIYIQGKCVCNSSVFKNLKFQK